MKISRRWTLLAWPGLPQLWLRGAWSGLLIAVSCSLLASLLLAGKLVWYEWLPVEIEVGGLILLVVAWIGSAFHAETTLLWHELSKQSEKQQSPENRGQTQISRNRSGNGPAERQANKALANASNTKKRSETLAAQRLKERKRILAQLNALFAQAQTHYLKGDWLSAEQLLIKVLRHNRRDAEALLLLATLYRRTKRYHEAETQLSKLSLLEASNRWEHEISKEQCLLLKAKQAISTRSRATERADENSKPNKPAKKNSHDKTEENSDLTASETILPIHTVAPPSQQSGVTTTIKAA